MELSGDEDESLALSDYCEPLQSTSQSLRPYLSKTSLYEVQDSQLT